MAKLPLSNCLYCGRDTAARSGICPRCVGGSRYSPTDEGKGRKGRRPTESLDAMDEFRDEDGLRDGYHGDTIRDDI